MAHAQDHDFFIPNRSIWPPVSCLGIGILFFGIICFLHVTPTVIGSIMMGGGLLLALLGAISWWRDSINEARERGYQNVPTVLELANRYGMLFFIVSEIMFFAAFFAAFFYLGNYNISWPPENIPSIDIHLPIINTLLLLTSGVTITWAHHAVLDGHRKTAILTTMLTWQLGVLFLIAQAYEYMHAGFGMSGGAYGTVFYMLTGFHGFHVLVGSIMIMVLHNRLAKGDFSEKHHFYFEATAWYWHFVDVVWVGLFLFVYAL
ncbi:MAG: cytochrome c oxidase subunit 3 [Alphaproteobacteria bacterium]|nr:cytochrome c oxidase subunit 3 [Alphaproteobacteria bacterium]MDD9919877.1 cytochrome c oxidase subunit 3 [Alphaproteobacteria bacterium]